ncbi:MAG: tripartite tricarboxylate transporter substrate binding protein [Betaproteobacteria bacterium]|nr:tripartite tricarboxylate transporter substrate binding protein [Betaproteobacteria bacterium]
MNTMRMIRPILIVFVAGCAAAAGAQSTAAVPKSSYPDRPIRVLVGVPPGGSTDMTARIVADKFAEALGQQIVIDNRGGAGGTIAGEIVARASPDGHTLLFAYAAHTTTPFLYKSIPYDAIKSFTPITQVATQPVVLIAYPPLPVNSISELIAYAKANPGKLNIGISGGGSSGHIAAEHLKQLTGAEITTIIYKGAGPAVVALMSGEVQLAFAATSGSIAFIKQGKMKALALTSKQRVPYLPGIPTMEEAGLGGLEATSWQGVLGPAGLPRAIVDRLYTEMAKLLRLPEVRERLAATGSDPIGSTPDEFAAEIKRQLDVLGKVIKAAGIQPQ